MSPETRDDLVGIARVLDEAERTATSTRQLGAKLDIDHAYQIQRQIRKLREERGEAYVGPKLGFTSESKMKQMGVSDIIVGFLTDAMAVNDGGTLDLSEMVHPRIEPEIVFHLGEAVVPEPDETVERLAQRIHDATDKVAAGLEIIDSRYEDFKFSLSDVVADNTSAARFVVGAWQDFPREIDGLLAELIIDGQVIESSTSSAILGNPVKAFAQLASMTLKYGFDLPADSVILAGSMTAANYLRPNMAIEARVEGLHPATVTAVNSPTVIEVGR